MEQYTVTGMTCAACQARVERAVSQVPGVTACAVSLLTNSMGVEGAVDPGAVIAAVEKAGYGAALKGAEKTAAGAQDDALADRETPRIWRRLIVSLCLLVPLMYVGMGHGMWGWPMSRFFAGNHMALGLLQMLLAACVMVVNQRFFISGFRSVFHGAPNMDTLVALGAGVSFGWSVGVLFAMTGPMTGGNAAMTHSLYFESAAMILTLITVGKLLESYSKGRTTDALRGLMKLAPKTAVLLRGGVETEVPVEQVRCGDSFVVRPGESIPVDKAPGDPVSAATINQSGFLRCQATRVGEDTTLAQIIRMVSDAAATKAPIARIADRVSGVFVPAVIAVAAVTFIVWLLIGQTAGYALARGISVLVISCPCALGLATPVAIMVGSGKGAKNGILFKTAVSLEETGKMDIIALDKTGTITRGEPAVTRLVPAPGTSEEELLTLAAALEAPSEHPLARAVLRECQTRGLAPEPVTDFAALPGSGVTALLDGVRLQGGSMGHMAEQLTVPESLQARAETLAQEGATPLLFARDGALLGIVAVADEMREDSPEAIRELQNMGVRVVMLTGDNVRTARAVGREAGVDDVIAEVLPDGKEAAIRALARQGKAAMVGDGINDAPALTRADIGIAIGAGTDVAMDAADIVLMKSSLRDVAAAVRLSRATLRNIHQNLFWAFFYNIICIPLAAGAYVRLGITLNPMIGAAAMSLSSFYVVANALRLNFFHLHDTSRDKPRRRSSTPQAETAPPPPPEPETLTLEIEGMMCTHCEAAVRQALESVPGVTCLSVSHETGTAVVRCDAPAAQEALKAAVEAEDYEVLSIR